MKQKGFAPILMVLIIVILGVVGYLGYKDLNKGRPSLSLSLAVSQNNYTKSTSTPEPIFVTTNARITKTNGGWGKYEDLNYKFSFEFPWAEGVRLDETKTRIEYPYSLSGGTIGYSPDINITYLANPKRLTLEKLIINTFNSDPWNQNNNIRYDNLPGGYQKYSPEGNPLQIYINRVAPGANVNQNTYVLSPNEDFALNIVFFLKTPEVNRILSTLNFTK